MESMIRFCSSGDGVRIATVCTGDGPPLVKVPNYLSHLEYEESSPVWSHWLAALSSGRRLVRYDLRGCGLSDRAVDDLSIEAFVHDLEVVVDAYDLSRFALLGISAGASTAVAYAARHPERVAHLVLYGGYCRGRNHRPGRAEPTRGALLTELMRTGWGQDNPAFRRVFTTLFVPDGSPEQVAWFDDLQRVATSAENAVRLTEAFHDIDVTAEARAVRAATLVLHARRDAIVPFEEGRELAALIPSARFVPLDSTNHVLLSHEPAWTSWREAVEQFLAAPPEEPSSSSRHRELVSMLTSREREVLSLIAAGFGNDEIAERLFVSQSTVRNHITRIFQKLSVRTRPQAMVVAQQAGLRP